MKSLQDVVEWGLCSGCGACRFACGEEYVSLVDIEKSGIRPQFGSIPRERNEKGLAVCPGIRVDGTLETGEGHDATKLDSELGPALEMWKGYARDQEVRYCASSGGVLSALSLYCLEQENMAFILHSAMDLERPWLNRTVKSRTREEVLKRAGSRYAPSSPCDGLGAIEGSDRACVFVGKPCDTAAVRLLRRQRPELDRKLGLVLSFFCAGTPSTRGTLDLIEEIEVPRETVSSVRYRGEGWPGRFTVKTENGKKAISLSYEESWERLSRYRPLRCHLCPDGFGQVADISCGDAWDDFNNNGNPGRSIVIVRTQRGREILHRAAAAGYVELVSCTADNVLAAQPNLVAKRREILSRLTSLWLFSAPVPQFKGFSLLHGWMRLPFRRKARSILGSIKRVMFRRLWRRRPIFTLLSAGGDREGD